MAKAVNEIMTHTKEYLQPNPTTRAKMNMMNISSKIQVLASYLLNILLLSTLEKHLIKTNI